MTTDTLGAAEVGLVSCTTCSLLSRPAQPATPGYCPRCGAKLVWRRHNSIQYTWALVIAAAICYVPANVLPVLRTTALGETEADTIMGGVIFLYDSGSWPLALIVLVASVMIPLGKLVALGYLLITVQRGSKVKSHQRTRLYYVMRVRRSLVDARRLRRRVHRRAGAATPSMWWNPGFGVVFLMADGDIDCARPRRLRAARLIWDAGRDREVSHG